jgi:hypothetical protein
VLRVSRKLGARAPVIGWWIISVAGGATAAASVFGGGARDAGFALAAMVLGFDVAANLLGIRVVNRVSDVAEPDKV